MCLQPCYVCCVYVVGGGEFLVVCVCSRFTCNQCACVWSNECKLINQGTGLKLSSWMAGLEVGVKNPQGLYLKKYLQDKNFNH